MTKISLRAPIKLGLLIALLAIGGIGNAWARHPHGHVSTHVGVYFGPVWGPAYYPAPYYYYPPSRPIIIERAPPPIYVEQAEAEPAPAPNQYWYYCKASKAYYPYVGECPSGWQRVLPQPPQP